MASISSVAVSGLHAAQTALNVSAHNVANVNTPAFRRQQLVQTERQSGGVSTEIGKTSIEGPALESDLVAQLQAKNSFLANLAVFKTSNQMLGGLLDKAV